MTPSSGKQRARRSGYGLFMGLALVGLAGLGFVVTRDSWAWVSAHPEYRFDPRRIDLGARRPAWMQREALAEAFFAAYLRAAGPPFSLHDDVALAGYERSVGASPWVHAVGLRRELPRTVRLELDLRQPVLAVLDTAGHLWLLAADGTPLPLERGQPGLAELEQELAARRRPDGGLALPDPAEVCTARPEPFGLPLVLGGPALDPRGGLGDEAPGRRHAADAARIAALFEGEVRPYLTAAGVEVPPLLGVDASNCGYRRFLGRAEYRLVLLDPEGHPVYLDWGHAPGSPYPVLPWQDKARNLRRLLGGWPGLRGLDGGDLRFSRSWREQARLRDPEGGQPR
ncbi:MAG: hypothetical protein R3F30_03660 [Planctomycetota bacterium]